MKIKRVPFIKLSVFLMSLFTLLPIMAHSYQAIDFKNISLRDKPNEYLACPEFINPKAHKVVRTYDLPVQVLSEKVISKLQQEPRVTVLFNDKYYFHLVQKTFLFRFPDFIDIEFFEINDTQSTFCVYSRAKYGHYDFDVNKNRVNRILAYANLP